MPVGRSGGAGLRVPVGRGGGAGLGRALLGRAGVAAAGEGQEAGAGGGGGRGEAAAYGALRDVLGAFQDGGGERVGPERAQGGEVVGLRLVPGGQGVLEQLQVAGEAAGQGTPVAGEVVEQERSGKPASRTASSTDAARRRQSCVSAGVRGAVEDWRAWARRRLSTCSSAALNAMPPRDP